MIIFFRNLSENWLVKILMFLVAVSMAGLFGLGSMTGMWGRDQSAVVVGNSSIKGQEILQTTEKEIKRISKITNGQTDMTIKEAYNNGVVDRVIKDSTNSLLYQSMMDDLDLTASDQAVSNYIVNNPLFQTMTGAFDRTIVNAYLQQMQMSEQAFAHALREELARKHLTEAIKAIVVPPQMLKEKMYDYLYETRDMDTLLISPESVKITQKPDKETLQAYYDSMEEQLYAPEYRTITLLKMNLNDVLKDIKVDDETLKQMYEEKRDLFSKAEQRRVEQILFDDEEKANEVYAELTSNNFATIAKEKANQENIDLGWIEKRGVVEEIGDAVFAAPVNEVLPPVKSIFGYHILIVREVKAAEEKTFEQVKDDLIKAVQSEKAYDLLIKKAKQVDEALGEGLSLADAAKRANFTLSDPIVIDAGGADKKGKASELPAGLVQEIFLSKKGEATSLHDYQNGYIVAQVDDIKASYLKPFDAVQDELKAEWVKDQQKKQVADFARKVLVAAQKDKLLKTVATVYHLDEKSFDEVTRTDIGDMSSENIEQVFNAAQGDIRLIELPENHYLVVLIKKIQPADKEDVASKASLQVDLKQKMTEGVMDEFLAYYYQKEKVKVNQNVIDETFRPYLETKE